MRARMLFSGAVLVTALCSAANAGESAARMTFNIQSQPIEGALADLGEQAGLQIIVRTEEIGSKQPIASEVSGNLSVREALEKILANSGLTYQFLDFRTVRVASVAASPREEEARSEREESDVSSGATAPPHDMEAGRDASSDRAHRYLGLEEVLVTAQKRQERLMDVPIPVTAIGAESLVDANQLRLQDYYTRIPGLTVVLGGDGGTPQLTIRGLTTGGLTNPTVGVVVDDVPYGSSTFQGSGFLVPDIDPSDLARVEVLRGPQGTLYGASNMGGLLKYVTVDPSTDAFSGRVQAGVSSVQHGDEMGYSIRGAVNAPIGETLAVRASAFTRRDPGYIDDPVLGVEDVNWGDTHGGRLSALWTRADFTVRLSAFYQDNQVHGSSEVYQQPGLGDLQQSALKGTGGYHRKSQAYSAVINAQIGRGELTSVSGYTINDILTNLDLTPTFGGATQAVFGVTGTPNFVRHKTNKFTQELRLAMPIADHIEWRLGAFYTDEDTSQVQRVFAQSDTGALLGLAFEFDAPATFEEYAVFTDLTFRLTERFDLQVGARQSRNEQSLSSVYTGPFVPLFFLTPSPFVVPEVESTDDAFTYLLTPRWKLSSNIMAYARMASGYRPGGPNSNSALLGVPSQFDSDSTRNYEVGVKGTILDDMLTFDASLYRIDWEDIQLQLRDPTLAVPYYANAGTARSQGLEIALSSNPMRGFSIATWAAWNDAELTEDLPSSSLVVGRSGDRLPYGNRFSGSLALDQRFPLGNRLDGTVGASLSYVGERKGMFQPGSAERETFPAYAQVDVRATLRWNDAWTANLFVTNVADKRGVLRGGRDGPLGLAVPTINYIQPRTVGLSVTKSL